MSLFIAFSEKQIGAFENRYDYDAAYLKALLRASPGGFRAFDRFGAMGRYRRALSPEVYYVANLAALQTEDCGTCAQLVVRMAKEAGVSEGILRSAYERDGHLPPPLREVYEFASGVAANQLAPGLRDAVRRRLGEEGLAELSLCIASARVYPCLKRALGFAGDSCERAAMDWETSQGRLEKA